MNTFFSILLAILLLATPALAQGPGNMTEEDLSIAEYMFWGILVAAGIGIGVVIFKLWPRFVEKRRQIYTELQLQLGKIQVLMASVMAPRSHRIIRDSLRLRIWQLEVQAESSPDPDKKSGAQDELPKVKALLEEQMKKPVFGGVTLGDMVPSSPLENIIRGLRGDDPTGGLQTHYKTPNGEDVVIHFTAFAPTRQKLQELEAKKQQMTKRLKGLQELVKGGKLADLELLNVNTEIETLNVQIQNFTKESEQAKKALTDMGPESIKLNEAERAKIVNMAQELRIDRFLTEQFAFPQLSMELPGNRPPRSFMQHLWGSILGKALLMGYEVDPKTNTPKAKYENATEMSAEQRKYLREIPLAFLGRDSASNIENRTMPRNVVAMGYLLAFFHLISQEEQRFSKEERDARKAVDLMTHVFPVEELNNLAARYSEQLLGASSNEKTRDNVKILLDNYAGLAKMIDALPWYHGQESREMAATYTIQA